MSSTQTGSQAEDYAVKFLENEGFKILARNWRNRWCEIDIVAQKNQRIHFVEVKFRRSATHGSGLDYITWRKAKQMEFAALLWVADNHWEHDYQLDVISIEGEIKPKLLHIPNTIPF